MQLPSTWYLYNWISFYSNTYVPTRSADGRDEFKSRTSSETVQKKGRSQMYFAFKSGPMGLTIIICLLAALLLLCIFFRSLLMSSADATWRFHMTTETVRETLERLVGHWLFLRKQESTPRPERKSISREKWTSAWPDNLEASYGSTRNLRRMIPLARHGYNSQRKYLIKLISLRFPTDPSAYTPSQRDRISL